MAKRITNLADLTPDERNANRGTERGRAMLEHSLRQYGAGRSVLADKHGNLIAGNKTVEVAAEIGLPIRTIETDGRELVVVQRNDLDLAEGGAARELAYADNRVGQVSLEWEVDQVAADVEAGVDLSALWSEDELAALLGEMGGTEGLTDPDAVPAPPAEPITKPGDLWLLGEHRLYCGDSTDASVLERLMSNQRAACVFTSPPYAVGVDYGDTYQDTIAELRSLLGASAPLWLRHIEPGGYAVINFGDVAPARDITGTDEPCEYPMALEYWPIFRDCGYVLWSRRVWCKPNPRVHSPWCIQSNRAATDWEHVWTWKVPGRSRIGRIDGRSPLGWVDTTHEEGVAVGKNEHGAGMATLVAIRAIEIHANPGEIVLEPFGGTGTTLIAAEQLGRVCYGLEISPAYCDVIVRRWEEFTGRQAVRDGA